MKIISWNVNGLEACRNKGFLKFVKVAKPDIVCCQETKVSEQFKIKTPGYIQIWNRGSRPGYSGTLVLTIREPLSHSLGFGIEKFDVEGRLITLEFEDYYVLNVYAPSIHENAYTGLNLPHARGKPATSPENFRHLAGEGCQCKRETTYCEEHTKNV